MDLEIEARTVLGTGGSKGIRYGIAEALAQEVICAGNEEELEEAAAQQRNHGSSVMGWLLIL
ncbi:hypothetical protein ACKGJO_10885 [Gracilimonas sp. Q87]|uniref:hypothetical protein n=1 Tax=Gracilimonas sp. Q87 TaxID=3384766 RepID=UPI003983E847